MAESPGMLSLVSLSKPCYLTREGRVTGTRERFLILVKAVRAFGRPCVRSGTVLRRGGAMYDKKSMKNKPGKVTDLETVRGQFVGGALGGLIPAVLRPGRGFLAKVLSVWWSRAWEGEGWVDEGTQT